MPLGQTITHSDGSVSYQCSHCGNTYSSASRAERCCVYHCGGCGTEYNYEEDAQSCCMSSCPECGSLYETDEDAYRCCESVRLQQEERLTRMDYPHEVLDNSVRYWITVPELPRRPVRLCSIEQELSMGGPRVAHLLYDLGISQHDRLTNYSADAPAGYAVVKQDGTLDRENGGEVLYARMNLASRGMSQRFSKALSCIRELRNMGYVQTGRNAGTHIHIAVVSASGLVFGPAQMANLYEIFSFCEDVLFRLSAAGWPAHRGTQYTLLVENKELMKEGGETKAGKLAKLAMRDRHFALNFQRLLNAAHACRCGACAVGDWAECECGALKNGTVEWRIFNATTKPETLHGWLLLAHALTAKAFDYTLGELQPNGFERTEQERHGWILGWIMNECPLTREEKRVILSLARRSPGFDLDWDTLAESVGLLEMTDEHGDDEQFGIMSS